MDKLSSKQKNKLRRLLTIADKKEVGIIEELNSLEDKIDSSFESIENKVIEAIKIASETQKMEGKTGEQGLKGDRGEKGDNGKDGKDGKDGRDGRDGRDGIDGVDGKDGLDGLNGIDGKDGSPDTGKQIVDKINDLDTDDNDLKIDAKHIKNLPKSETIYRGGGGGLLQVYHDATLSGSGTQAEPLKVVGGGSGTWYQDEVLTRTDGITYTLANTPISVLFLYLNGQLQLNNVNYTRSGATITMVDTTIDGDILSATYS